MTDNRIEKGDLVSVRGIVVETYCDDKVMVESITAYPEDGVLRRWFKNDQVTLVTKAADADEPPPGATVEVVSTHGTTFFFRRSAAVDDGPNRWTRLGGTGYYMPIKWRAVKDSGYSWSRLRRDGEV